ncbi:MAG: hypothetical protein RMJ96_03090 [Candidatus Bipolaricaulota bacterium]|nr:cytochrome c3 family protein [Candidatus Bipolaricaulota bacterium]MDW8110575.1 hypothetical protein [Candidatus Bipolaricaulota bacterium]MDW8329513.1 hypothetical protein [Candidatus Bipolaricaulota bacterium]
MKKMLSIALALLLLVAVTTIVGGLKFDSSDAALAQFHHWVPAMKSLAQGDPAKTFPTSLHATREGKRTWYRKENGGFEVITGIPIEKVGCLSCHPGTYADGSKVDPATYKPDCKDCHAKLEGGRPTEKVKQETCLKCHRRQGFEIANYPDVHRAKGMDCMACHTSADVHGDGTPYKSWLEPGAVKAACEDCHKQVSPNVSHAVHNKTVHCTSCHSQTVISCYNCHFESEVAAGIKRNYGVMRDFSLLLKRKGEGDKVYSATLMTLTYQGKSFVALAPYRAHTVTKQGKACMECHRSPAIQEYDRTGKITISKWDGSKLVFTKGVIPVPPDWQKAFQLDFVNYTGDPAKPETDPAKWVFLKSGADLMQMLYAEPLTREQIEKLRR